MGSPTVTVIAPRRGNQDSARRMDRVPRMAMGTTGTPASAAATNAPIWKGISPGSLDPDMLEERARLMLNYGFPDDTVILTDEPPG